MPFARRPLADETINVYEPTNQSPPPIDVVLMIKGGHGIQVDDPKKAAKRILQTRDYLNNPPNYPIDRE